MAELLSSDRYTTLLLFPGERQSASWHNAREALFPLLGQERPPDWLVLLSKGLLNGEELPVAGRTLGGAGRGSRLHTGP